MANLATSDFATDARFVSATSDPETARKIQHLLERASKACDRRDQHMARYVKLCTLAALIIFTATFVITGSFGGALAAAILAVAAYIVHCIRQIHRVTRLQLQVDQLMACGALLRPAPVLPTADQAAALDTAREHSLAEQRISEEDRLGVRVNYAAHDAEGAMQALVDEGLL